MSEASTETAAAAARTKLLLLYNAIGQRSLLCVGLDAPDDQGTFKSRPDDTWSIPWNLSNSTPGATYDPASGNVYVVCNSNGWVIQNTLAAPANFVAQSWVWDAGNYWCTTDITLTQNNTIIAWDWPNNNYAQHDIRYSCKKPDWPTTGNWQEGYTSWTNTATRPVLLRLANDWIFTLRVLQDGDKTFYLDSTNPQDLQNAILTNNHPTVVWRKGRLDFTQPLRGPAAGVISGDSSTNRKMHIFLNGNNNTLYYFNLPLGKNGLPTLDSNNFIQPQDQQTVTQTSYGAISATIYGKNLYCFHQTENSADGANTIGVRWRSIDSTSAADWKTGTLPPFKSYKHPLVGGITPVWVPIEF